MTDPTDETPRTTPPDDPTLATPSLEGALPPPGAGSINPVPAGATNPRPPDDEPLPPIRTELSADGTTTSAGSADDAADRSPPLAVNPDRAAATAWREPPWIPPRAKERRPTLIALIFGVVLIAIGVYFLLQYTLGVAVPAIAWRSLWPIALIVIGGLILLRSLGRR